MGCDIWLFCEGFLSNWPDRQKKWINIDYWYRQDGWAEYRINESGGFGYTNLINNNRDYGLFYLLAGVRGDDDEESYPPIAKAKGLPEQMDSLIVKNYKYILDTDAHNISYLTLKELKDSGYGAIMPLRGWVYEDEYDEAMSAYQNGEKYQLPYVDIKCKNIDHEHMVVREWDGYLNLNLTYMIENMKKLKKERNIDLDDEIRAVFWFGS